MDSSNNLFSRRQFIRQASCAAVGAAGLYSAIWDLRRINAAALTGSDYGALVCVFLAGGNDSNNMFIPYEQSAYNNYSTIRKGLAISRNSLLPVQPLNPASPQYAFHPSMPEMQSLFNAGQLAVLANVGTLVVPTTRDQYRDESVPLPRQLYSHNDQQVQWQTGIAAGPTDTGWGGRVADVINSLNTNQKVSMSISLAGVNTFEVGRIVSQYHVNTGGPVSLQRFGSGQSSNQTNAVAQLLAQQSDNLYEDAYRGVFKRAIDSDAIIRSSLANINLTTVFPNTYLGNQLKMIARLIGCRNNLSLKRQIFFCEVGGYDNHDKQLPAHAALLQELSQCFNAFHSATTELGIADKVTTFTASDFSRGFTPNGDGTDHAWGSHHLVMGNAVKGGYIYGTFPTQQLDGPDDAFRGSWIPTTSVDEYSATLARWFGVGNTDLNTIFPNLHNFAQPDLGFML